MLDKAILKMKSNECRPSFKKQCFFKTARKQRKNGHFLMYLNNFLLQLNFQHQKKCISSAN